MKYINLLRGINVGGNHKVDMKLLKQLFESLGLYQVVTYLNTGNVLFETEVSKDVLFNQISSMLSENFEFEIPFLIKTKEEIENILCEIPSDWENDNSQKTDVAFLFRDVDSQEILDELPLDRKFIRVKYIKGAIIWNVSRQNQNKSKLAKIIATKFYKKMTVRNINTVRIIGEMLAN